jgi:hypothetical protein
MPYCAPFAAMPRISRAPRFAATNASPVTQAGSARPDSRKSRLELMLRRASHPIPRTVRK